MVHNVYKKWTEKTKEKLKTKIDKLNPSQLGYLEEIVDSEF